MFTYQKFLIKETDRFDPSQFPQLEESLQQTRSLLATEPAGPSTELIVAFVKGHGTRSQHAADQPLQAGQLQAMNLPLTVMEQLFESSQQNPAYRRDLENYITAFLNAGRREQSVI